MTKAEKKVIEAAKVIADMKAPSLESLLRRKGYSYEAERIAELVKAVESLNPPLRKT